MNSEDIFWTVHKGEGPLLATALHSGHELRPEVEALLALDEPSRLREEDPYTDRWTEIAPTRIIPHRSRFEVDLNRSCEQAIYIKPEDAWGLHIWNKPPPQALIERSLAEYDAFYAELRGLLDDLQSRYGRFVVFDLHAYNHRRPGPDMPPEDPSLNPEVNVGTGTMDRARWAPLVERFMDDLHRFDFLGRHLDVRENVKFQGRQFPGWIHRSFPDSACVLALEFKKFFMDEWTGRADSTQLEAIQRALESTVPGILEELERL